MLKRLTTTEDKTILVNPAQIIAVRSRGTKSDTPYSSVKMIDGKEFDVKEDLGTIESAMA